MIKYFDKDFWKFLLGFIAIVCTSLIILLASRLYQDGALIDGESQTGAIINTVIK